MVKSPFYVVLVKLSEKEKIDITDMVEGFTYEDCVEKDDLVRFTIKTSDVDLIDETWLKVGAELIFKYGYIGGLQSTEHLAQITNINIKFANLISVEVEALDKGNIMKKTTSNKIWKEQTASQIAETIASYYRLETSIEKTNFQYQSIPQGNRSDFEFLQYLATQEKDGSFHTFVKDDVLYFERKRLDSKSNRLFTYKEDIISFQIDYRGTSQAPSSVQTTATSFNPLTAETQKFDVNALKAKDDVKLGKVVPAYTQYDANADTKKGVSDFGKDIKPEQPKTEKENNVTGQFMPLPSQMPAVRMENMANSANKKSTQKELTANLVIEGDPTVSANGIVTIQNVGKKFSGNYYVVKITHRFSGSTYTTSFELQKNALNKSANTNITSNVPTSNNTVQSDLKTNETVGQKTENVKKTIQRYDQNANKL